VVRASRVPSVVLAIGLALEAVGAAEPAPVSIPDELTLQQALELYRDRGLDLLLADAAVQGATADLQVAKQIANSDNVAMWRSAGQMRTRMSHFVLCGGSDHPPHHLTTCYVTRGLTPAARQRHLTTRTPPPYTLCIASLEQESIDEISSTVAQRQS